MIREAAGGAIVGLALMGAVLLFGPAGAPDNEEAAFIQILNNYRAANALPPLLLEPTLEFAAEQHSTNMGQQNYFSHTSLDGRSPFERMCDAGYCYNTWKGENIAAGYETAAQVFEGWKASPGHNSIMLGVNYKVVGTSRVYTAGSTYGWYWTSAFGGEVTAQSYTLGTPTPTATPTPTFTLKPCPLDFNGDRVINSHDLIGFVFSMLAAIGDARYDPKLDLNRNGVINVLDMVGYANRMNTAC